MQRLFSQLHPLYSKRPAWFFPPLILKRIEDRHEETTGGLSERGSREKGKRKGREERKEEKKCSPTPSYPSGDGRREIWEHWKSRGIVSSSKHALRRIVITAQRENFSRYGSRSASGYRYEKKKKRKKMEKKFCSSKQYVNILYKRISNFYSSLWKFFFIFFFII